MSERSGTETRQRKAQVGVRLLPEEWERLREAADGAHCSAGEILRRAFLGLAPLPTEVVMIAKIEALQGAAAKVAQRRYADGRTVHGARVFSNYLLELASLVVAEESQNG